MMILTFGDGEERKSWHDLVCLLSSSSTLLMKMAIVRNESTKMMRSSHAFLS